MKNKKIDAIKSIDAVDELEKIMCDELSLSKEQYYQVIRKSLNVESFMNATDDNLDMLFEYMYSATHNIRLSNITVAQFIKDEYGDDSFIKEIYRTEKTKK
jgi:hypothetical protein